MVGPSTSNPNVSGTDKETMDDVIIDNVEGATKLYQALEIKENIHIVHYQDPRLQLVDEIATRQLLESEFPGEEILKEQRLYLEGDKTEKFIIEIGTTRRGRGRTSRASMRGVTISRDDRPATRSRLNLPTIPVSDKGKKVLKGPPEVKEKSLSKADEPSAKVTTVTKLVSANEEKKDKIVTGIILRKKKEISESKMVDATNPGKRQSTKVSEYIFQASKAEKEYFNRIKKAGNIFTKNVSKGGVTTMKDHQKVGKGFKRKG